MSIWGEEDGPNKHKNGLEIVYIYNYNFVVLKIENVSKLNVIFFKVFEF